MEFKATELLPTILDAGKWIGGAIVVAGGWIAGRWTLRRSRRERRNRIIKHLHGLPDECKAVLLEFYKQGVRTLRGAPHDPPMRVLISQGIVNRGPGGGTYDAVDSYLSIKPEVWDVMDSWVEELDEAAMHSAENQLRDTE